MTKKIQTTRAETSKESSGVFSSLMQCYSFAICHSSFVILKAAQFALVILIALFLSCSGKRITKANVDQVMDGMSKKQVESILGRPTSRTTEDFAKRTTYVYRQGKDRITILFKDDKVQSKNSTLTD